MKKLVSTLLENRILELLANPSFLYFTLSVFCSQVAFNMLNIVLIFLIFSLTNSNFAVAVLLLTVLIPQILLSFLGGVVADKHNKKRILIIGNFLRAVVLFILFFNFKSPAIVYIVTLLISGITQFYVPAESPLIPMLVKRDKLVAANSIFGISLFGSILIGYVLAGPVVSALGRSNVFLLLSAVFAAAGLFASFIREKHVKEHAVDEDVEMYERSIMVEFKSSFSILAKTKKVADAFFLLIFSQIVIFILATLIPGYAKDILQIPAEDLSLVIFAPAAIGMILAGVGMGSVFHKTKKEKLTSYGVFISGFALMLLPFTSKILARGFIITLNSMLPHTFMLTVFNFVILIAFSAGFANALIFIPSQAVIQETIPEDFRSKIYGLLFALIGVFSLLPVTIAGALSDLIGVGTVFFSIGLLIVILGFLRNRFVIRVPKRFH
ncbi:MAG TPA: MFS transporter [Patescibacteria group bacterium]|nr:MFS transporter [Patescibacteria group bacterium]